MKKVDLRKQLKHLYTASAKEPALVEVPKMNFLMVDGAGDPNTAPEFQQAVEALYGVAFTLKFMLKKRGEADYTVMGLEGLWWAEDMREFSVEDKSNWKWTLMIAQPDFVTREHYAEALAQVRAKKDSPALAKIRFGAFEEGLCAQVMHLGPYSEEGPTIARLHQFIAESGHRLRGKHHEIYLSDPRRSAPEKMRTILRQGVR
jgi:hypothetical protein